MQRRGQQRARWKPPRGSHRLDVVRARRVPHRRVRYRPYPRPPCNGAYATSSASHKCAALPQVSTVTTSGLATASPRAPTTDRRHCVGSPVAANGQFALAANTLTAARLSLARRPRVREPSSAVSALVTENASQISEGGDGGACAFPLVTIGAGRRDGPSPLTWASIVTRVPSSAGSSRSAIVVATPNTVCS